MMLKLCKHCKNEIMKYKIVISFNRSNSSIETKNGLNSDVLIVGGGIVGSSTAYWLKVKEPKLVVTIVERDITFKEASTVLSVGGVRQQFSEPENIQMSLFCSHVLNNMNKYFANNNTDNDVDTQFIKRGYLLLSSGTSTDIIKSNYSRQRELGASVSLLSKNEIKKQWPWINVDDVECAVHGTDNEGWFDPWLLLCHVSCKIKELGVRVIHGSLDQLHSTNGQLDTAEITTPEGVRTSLRFSQIVNASGAWASKVAELAEIAVGMSGSEYPLFVNKCKRYVYNYSCPSFPRLTTTPMVIDYTGVYFRKESSGDFICGLAPTHLEEPNCDNLDVDYDWFDEKIWHPLSNRVPMMEEIKVKSGWAGFYDYNVKDQNLIIGRHPVIKNLILCNGSSGHGIQHGLAIGRANMEIILFNEFKSIDLRRLSYDRFLTNNLVFEKNIY